MHFFYLDETGCNGADLNVVQEPIFVLGPVDISWYPQLRGGECQEAKEGDGGLVVSGCDAPAVLDATEEALDAVALLVEGLVVGVLALAMAPWGTMGSPPCSMILA